MDIVQTIFDYFLAQLNDNNDDLVYAGNYVFRFFQDSMTVLEPVTGKLVSEEIDISPVALMTKTPVPFVESNKRIDWLLEFGILIRMQGQEYDAAVDLDYANIKSVTDALQGAVYTSGTTRYVFKTQEPDYKGYTVLGRSKFAIITCVMNVTQIDFGYFGNDSVWIVGSKTLDIVSVAKTSTRRFYTADKKSNTANDFNRPIGRAVVLEITFNYKDETDLLSEVNGKQTLAKTYTVSETFNSGTAITWTMVVESASEIQQKGVVKQLIVRLVEV